MRTRTLSLLALGLLSGLLGSWVQAEEFIFSFTTSSFRGGPSVEASGVLSGDSLGGNEWQITGVQGTMNGLPLMLAPTTDEGIPDFIFYTGAGSGGYRYGFPFDLSGVGLANGQVSVLLACGSISYFEPDCEMLAPPPYGTSGLNFTYTQASEPTTLALLMLGVAAVALQGLRRGFGRGQRLLLAAAGQAT